MGSVKTPDLEAVMACEPDLILMGGRMAEYIDTLSEIAPVLRLTTVSDDGLVETIRSNAKMVGSIFGETEQVDALLAQYDARIAALAESAQGKTSVLGMCTSGSFNLLGNDSRCSLIVNEVGFDNIGADAATTGSGRGGSGESSDSRGGLRAPTAPTAPAAATVTAAVKAAAPREAAPPPPTATRSHLRPWFP